jgi:predicted ATPase/DNA-binding SARP family transcriptional activator
MLAGEGPRAALPVGDNGVTAVVTGALRSRGAGRIIGRMGTEGRLVFGVLGPLEVRQAGVAVRLGGPRQRALLGLLVLRANELVRVEELVDQLFGAERSEVAVNAVRVAVSRLRRLLGNGEAEGALITRAGGYVLRVEAEQLDAEVFKQLSEEGQRLLSAAQASAAAARLGEALSLWRGPALADLAAVDCFQGEIRRLEELKLVAVMERIEAELVLGQSAELVGELEALIEANPLQERLRGQLMLALYRSGRQADALTAYRQASELLRDELGLEPSPQLRELERSILNQDPTVGPPPRATPAAPPKLPVSATAFVGRTRELAELTALLQNGGTRLLTLTGAGGGGKTRLALQVAETCAAEYRDGTWFVAFADITDPQLIPSTMCQTFGLAEQAALPPVRRLEQWLGQREVLLVLDNLEQLADGTAVLAKLLGACPGLTLLVTSREPLHLAGEQQYEVPVLEPEDAIALFESRTQAVVPGLLVHPKLADAICARLDRLPLAIELAAARTKALSLSELSARLDKSLPLLTGGPRDAPQRQQTLTATIDWSYRLLNHDEQRLFRRFSVFAGGVDFEAAKEICDADLDGLQSLIDKSLLHRTDRDRFFLLKTTQEYGYSRLQAAGELTQLRRDHAAWFHRIAMRPEDHFRSPEQAAWLSRLYADTDNFRAALAWSFEWDVAGGLELATVLYRPWLMHGHVEELISWFERAPADLNAVDKRTRAAALRAFGEALNCNNQHDRARQVLQQSLILFREIDDRPGEAFALNVLGMVCWAQGSLPQAIDHSETALVIYRETGNRTGIARSLHLTGAYLRDAGDFARGEAALQEARVMFTEVGDRSAAAASILCLGDLALDTGESDQAACRYREALDTVIEFGDERSQAYCIAGLACVAAMHGDPYAAGRLWAVAEAVDGRLGTCFRPEERRRYDGILMPLADDQGFRAGQAADGDMTLAHAVREIVDRAPAAVQNVRNDRRRATPSAHHHGQ